MHLAGGKSLGDGALEGELLLLQVISRGVLDLELSHSVRKSGLDLVLLSALDLEGHGWVGDDLLDTGDVGLELLAGLKLLGESLVGGLELLGVVDHVLNLRRRELANRVGDGDVGRATGGLLSGGNLEDTVDIDLENDLEDGLTSLHWWDWSKGELSEGGVVLTVDTLSLEDWELNGLLVVGDSGESALLDGWDGLSTGDNWGEDVTLHGDTKGKWDDIQKEEVGGLSGGSLSGEDTSLDSGTVGDSLIWVDGLLELLAVEEIGKELLDLWDTGRSSDKDDLVNLGLVHAGILEDLGNWVKGSVESLGVDVLETGTGDLGGEVLTLEEGVDLDGGLGTVGESALGTLASGSETAESTWVVGHVLLGLALELLLEVLKEVGIEILSSQVGVTGGSLDGEDTSLDGQEGDIESSTTEIVDENVALLGGLSGTETVSNGGSGWLVDDTEDVKSGDGTGILGSLTLVVVEVSWNGDDGLGDLLSELDLSNLLHLWKLSANLLWYV